MKNLVYFLLLFVNAISAFTLKQVMERLQYIEERLYVESKFRREGLSAVSEELGSIKRVLEQVLTTRNENKDSGGSSVTGKTYTVSQDSSLLRAFKAEKNLNTQVRREITIIKRHVQDLEIKTEEFNRLIEENSLNLEKQFKQTMQTTGESLSSISNDINELYHHNSLILGNINSHKNLTLKLTDNLISGNLFCIVKENTCEMKINAKESSFSAPSLPAESITSSLSVDSMTSSQHVESKTSSLLAENIGVANKSDSCKDSYDKGNRISGVYSIGIRSGKSISVYCDMTTDGGGWTVFQRRKDGTVDFFRNWSEYKTGFGDLDGEFWLGNEYLNILTDTVEKHELRVDLEDFEGNRAYAKYSRFKVGPESENYKLEVRGYTGDAGDSLENPSDKPQRHNGMEFTTKDRDNDKSSINCAIYYYGAWWYNDCYDSNLNGLYHMQPRCTQEWICVVWCAWRNSKYSLRFTEMKLR